MNSINYSQDKYIYINNIFELRLQTTNLSLHISTHVLKYFNKQLIDEFTSQVPAEVPTEAPPLPPPLGIHAKSLNMNQLLVLSVMALWLNLVNVVPEGSARCKSSVSKQPKPTDRENQYHIVIVRVCVNTLQIL